MLAKREQIRVQKLQLAKSKTFETCAKEFIEHSRPSWKYVKHGQQWTNTLTQYAFPVIGQMPIHSVHTDDGVHVLKPIWQEKTETAIRLRGRIESVIDWSTVQGWRQGDNPARLKGHLEHLTPSCERYHVNIMRRCLTINFQISSRSYRTKVAWHDMPLNFLSFVLPEPAM